MFICRHVMDLDSSSLHHVSNKVILNLNVLGLVMKHSILYQMDPTITIYHSSVQDLLKQISKEISQTNCFTSNHASDYVLCFGGAQCYKLLFPTHRGYHGRSKAKIASICTLPIEDISDLVNIYVSMKLNISGRISQAKFDRPVKISQYVFGIYPMCMEGLVHELNQFF